MIKFAKITLDEEDSEVRVVSIKKGEIELLNCRLVYQIGKDHRKYLFDQYKEYIKQENVILERYHRQGQPGLRVARSRSMVMDILLENLVSRAISIAGAEKYRQEFAIFALGGYGREEMCPFSDVDKVIFPLAF